MKTSAPNSSASRQGFTLVEVLVSSFLTLMILGMLFSVLIGTIDAWEGATSKLEASSDMQLSFDTLRSDLSGMIVRQTQDDQEWLYSGPYYLDNNGDFQWGVGSGSEVTNTWLTFLSPSIDRDPDEDGSIVGLSYRTAYFDPLTGDSNASSDPTSDYKVFGLYKDMETPRVTFTDILRFGSDYQLIGSTSGEGYWGDTTTTTNLRDIETDGFLMPHVVRFAVTWMVRDPEEPELERYDETFEVRLGNRLEIRNDAGTLVVPDGTGGERLVAAEISITTISNDGMQRYRFFEGTANAAGQLPRIIQDFGRTQSIRVPIEY
jgi:type II secretory pathway pseudopilin PulG